MVMHNIIKTQPAYGYDGLKQRPKYFEVIRYLMDYQQLLRYPNRFAKRLREQLTALNVAQEPADLNRPSWRLHGLAGDRAGFLSITVQANWRITFRFTEMRANNIRTEALKNCKVFIS